MNRREAMATYVAGKRTLNLGMPANGICPASRLPYFNCRCDNHRCGDCGRRWSQRDPRDAFDCQCDRNRRGNGFPPHWRTGIIASSG